MKKKLEKRTWIYVQKPWEYEIECDKCGGRNIEWSEYSGHIWCFDCKIDTKGTGGVFSGPTPIQAATMLGMDFRRFDLKTKKIILEVKEADNPKLY